MNNTITPQTECDLSIFEVIDGKINLTKIGQHFGKNVFNWTKSKSTQQFLSHFSSASLLIVKGGNGEQGTWTTENKILEHFLNWCQEKTTDKFLRYEKEYGKLLENVFKDITKIVPQFPVDNYRIDFYLPQFNIAIEYDEKHHNTFSSQIRDVERETKIKSILGCTFVRVPEGKEIESINTILKLIIK
jgi:very-short-patch-repair endonuclease